MRSETVRDAVMTRGARGPWDAKEETMDSRREKRGRDLPYGIDSTL